MKAETTRGRFREDSKDFKKGNLAMKRIVCLLLVLAMLTVAFASCGKKKGDSATEGATTPAATEAATTPATEPATEAATTPATEPVTDAATEPATEAATTPATDPATEPVTEAATEPATEPATEAATEPVTEPATDAETEPPTTASPEHWETVGATVKALSESNRSFRFEMSEYGNAEKISKNDQFVAGPDSVELEVTPEIQVLVYNRNLAANELLGTSIEYVYWDYEWGSAAGQIDTVVQGNDPEAPDVFINMIFDLGKSTLNGDFKDVWTIPGSFFDFEARGWMKSWMESMSLTGDRAYTLAGDYFLDVLRAMGVVPFNMTMMNDNAAELATAILGEGGELDDEDLTTYFFDLVEDGGWTWELLGKLCAAIWVDSDEDGQNSIGDRLGFLASGRTNYSSSFFVYANTEKLFETYVIEDPEDPRDGKTWIRYAEMGGLGDIFDALKDLFAGRGALAPNNPNEGNTADNPGLSYHWIKFGKGEVLFAGACVLGALEDDAFQTMEDRYSVVPVPKVDAEKDYNTVIHNVGDAGAINVRTNPAKTKAISAYLQYCTEHSAEVREEFLEIVTKYKTTSYDQGTDRMLDLIYENVVNGRDKSIEDIMQTDSTCKPLRWHVLVMANNSFTHGSDDLSSQYESAIEAKQAYLDEKLETWYTLPTASGN